MDKKHDFIFYGKYRKAKSLPAQSVSTFAMSSSPGSLCPVHCDWHNFSLATHLTRAIGLLALITGQ
jgi:hypothetical protein